MCRRDHDPGQVGSHEVAKIIFVVNVVGDMKMPEIARFYGIIIKLFFGDHPPPHFHAVYGEYIGVFNIDSLDMIEGDLPKRAEKLVKEWAEMHKKELRRMWDEQKFYKLPPLE